MSDEIIMIQNLIYVRSKKNEVTICDHISQTHFCSTFCFYEAGVAMLSGLLNSYVAIAANKAIMRALVQVREYMIAAARGGIISKTNIVFSKTEKVAADGGICAVKCLFY